MKFYKTYSLFLFVRETDYKPLISGKIFSETNDLNTGLLIEVWSKGMIWDRAMGYHWIPLQTVQYSNEVSSTDTLHLKIDKGIYLGEKSSPV